MKIVMINGQNHKGSTYNMAKVMIDGITCEKEVKEFFLPKDLNHFCLGCYTCVKDETKCPYYAEKSVLLDELKDADLLVFTTPNYCLSLSAPLKAFFDLTFTYWMPHKPKEYMFDKRAIIFSTSAGASTKKSIQPIKDSLFYWGIPSIKKYGKSVQAMNWEGVAPKKREKIKKDMEKFASYYSKCGKAKPSIKTKFIFNIMAGMQKKGWGSGPEEKKYWEDKGWLGKERPWKKK